jgi:hypothetical protein
VISCTALESSATRGPCPSDWTCKLVGLLVGALPHLTIRSVEGDSYCDQISATYCGHSQSGFLRICYDVSKTEVFAP